MIDTKVIRDVVVTTGGDQYPIISLCDRIDELERKLKIAEEAINDSNRALNVYDNVLCNSTLKRNSDALKQIRGE